MISLNSLVKWCFDIDKIRVVIIEQVTNLISISGFVHNSFHDIYKMGPASIRRSTYDTVNNVVWN